MNDENARHNAWLRERMQAVALQTEVRNAEMAALRADIARLQRVLVEESFRHGLTVAENDWLRERVKQLLFVLTECPGREGTDAQWGRWTEMMRQVTHGKAS